MQLILFSCIPFFSTLIFIYHTNGTVARVLIISTFMKTFYVVTLPIVIIPFMVDNETIWLLWYSWWSKGIKWREKIMLERKLGGQKMWKLQRQTQSLQPWIRSSVWFMDYLPSLISCRLEALQYTLGTWQVKLICESISATRSIRHGWAPYEKLY